MNLPVATVVFGYDSLEMVRENIKTARGFKQMTASEMTALRERSRKYAADGRFELYKTSKKFDADEGRRQHGFPTQEGVAA